MEQLRLPMLTVYDGPRLIDAEIVDACATYREVVCVCWDLRTRRALTKRALAEEVDGLYPSHLSDYLSKLAGKRELPAKHINGFERACGNRAITQWLTRRAQLTILEQFIQQPSRRAA